MIWEGFGRLCFFSFLMKLGSAQAVIRWLRFFIPILSPPPPGFQNTKDNLIGNKKHANFRVDSPILRISSPTVVKYVHPELVNPDRVGSKHPPPSPPPPRGGGGGWGGLGGGCLGKQQNNQKKNPTPPTTKKNTPQLKNKHHPPP